MSDTLNHAMRRAATVLGGAGIEPKDVDLQDFVRTGYRAAARYLRSQGMGLLRAQSAVINIPETCVSLLRGATPGYPSDLIRPIEIRERVPAVVSPAADAGEWTAMRSSDGFLPAASVVPSTTLDLWDWREDKIVLRGNTTVHVDIQILYECELPALIYASSLLLIPDGLDAVAWLGASFAAADGGKKAAAEEWKGLATADLDMIAKSEAKVRKAAAARWGTQ